MTNKEGTFQEDAMTALPSKHSSGCQRRRGRPKNTWKRDLENEMWTARYKYSWRKMEAEAQNRAADGEEGDVVDPDKW